MTVDVIPVISVARNGVPQEAIGVVLLLERSRKIRSCQRV